METLSRSGHSLDHFLIECNGLNAGCLTPVQKESGCNHMTVSDSSCHLGSWSNGMPSVARLDATCEIYISTNFTLSAEYFD